MLTAVAAGPFTVTPGPSLSLRTRLCSFWGNDCPAAGQLPGQETRHRSRSTARLELAAGLLRGLEHRRFGSDARRQALPHAVGIHGGIREGRQPVGAHARDELKGLAGGLPLLRRSHRSARVQVPTGLVSRQILGSVEGADLGACYFDVPLTVGVGKRGSPW